MTLPHRTHEIMSGPPGTSQWTTMFCLEEAKFGHFSVSQQFLGLDAAS
jgi:DNA polymerase III delta prime subunit